MKIHNIKLVKRWNDLVGSIGNEYLAIGTRLSELEEKKKYYDLEEGITTSWMLEEAKYILSCYYESGHCRCDDRFESKESYKIWVSETGRLKRLIATLEKIDEQTIVEWEE